MRAAFVSAVTGHHGDRETERARRVRRHAEALAARGHEVVVLCSSFWTGPLERVADGVRYRALAVVADDDAFAARVPGAIARFRPDLVHAVHDRPGHVLAAKAGASLARAPLVVDWYRTDHPDGRSPSGALGAVRRRVGGSLRRRAARSPAAVLAPSGLVAHRVRELGAADDRVRVIPNAVDLDAVQRVEPVGDADVVFSRRLDADANLESLLLAVAELRDTDIRAAVIGDGPARAEYEAQARDLRIADRVSFLGDLGLEERLARFRGAHTVVHTARRTPFPTDLLRALACGCVGVVEYHADSSAHELVERRERGIRVSDDEELVGGLRRAAEFPHREYDPGFEEYGERRVLERYLECYRAVGALPA